jgi:hypothetical protein
VLADEGFSHRCFVYFSPLQELTLPSDLSDGLFFVLFLFFEKQNHLFCFVFPVFLLFCSSSDSVHQIFNHLFGSYTACVFASFACFSGTIFPQAFLNVKLTDFYLARRWYFHHLFKLQKYPSAFFASSCFFA